MFFDSSQQIRIKNQENKSFQNFALKIQFGL